MHKDGETKSRSDAGVSADHRARVADAFKGGVAVSVTTWSGRELRGIVSDRDQAGLLLDPGGDTDGAGGYTFLPWSSVEQVEIPELAPRRVKFLQG